MIEAPKNRGSDARFLFGRVFAAGIAAALLATFGAVLASPLVWFSYLALSQNRGGLDQAPVARGVSDTFLLILFLFALLLWPALGFAFTRLAATWVARRVKPEVALRHGLAVGVVAGAVIIGLYLALTGPNYFAIAVGLLAVVAGGVAGKATMRMNSPSVKSSRPETSATGFPG